MNTSFRLLGLGLLSAGAVLAGTVSWVVRRPWPQTRGTLTVDGLSDPVEVLRDRWGVPHIYAASLHDLIMAQGYVHAQDRLWQMEFNRRVGNGTLSELLGQTTLEADCFLRTIGLRRAAEKDWALLDSEMRLLLGAYTEGINAFLETHRSRLPLEFTILSARPAAWSPIDTLACGKVMSLDLGANREFELLYSQFLAEVGEEITRQFIPPYPDEAPVILPREIYNYAELHQVPSAPAQPEAATRVLGETTPEWGSNSWVVHGNHTQSGKPLLANDTHLGLSMPGVWYTNGLHLYAPRSNNAPDLAQRNETETRDGGFNCVGFSIPGVPFVFIGHNGEIAWGISNLGPDVQDFYLEKLDDPAQPTQYQFQDEWHDLEIISECIAIKGKESLHKKVFLTRHGPLMNEVTPGLREADPLALRWTGLEGSGLFQAIVQLNRARNWQEFRDALRTWDTPGQNFVYADRNGNIGYQATGKIPIRAPGHQGIVPVPGWSGEYEWQGFIPFDELPTAFNPATGMIVTANNKVVSDDYPYHLAYEWAPPYRAQHILDRLRSYEQIAPEHMREIQAETYGQAAAKLCPYLLQVSPENTLQARALDFVRAWDLRFEPDRVGASIYQVWYWFLVQHAIIDELGPELTQVYLGYAFLHIPLMEKRIALLNNRDEIVSRSFSEAIEWLARGYGKNPGRWQWGRLHTMTFVHQPLGRSGIRPLELLFNSKTVPAPGDYTTVNVGAFNFKKPFAMLSGPAQRIIIDLNDLDRVLAVHTTGQSGHLFHPHREDLIPLWQKVEYHPLFYRRQKVEAHATDILTLHPA